MTKKLRIGLIVQGGRGWLGGVEYTRNIVLALASLPTDVLSTFELWLISGNASDTLHQDLQSSTYNICYSGLALDPFTFQEIPLKQFDLPVRLWTRLQAQVFRLHNPRFKNFLIENKIDFVYPYFTEQSNPGYRCAAWIGDFQHKYLPQFFTQEELNLRDALFSRTARFASTVVLSSQSAEQDFYNFFPEAAHKSKVLSFRVSALDSWYEPDPVVVQRLYSLPDRFFLISNQFWQHKNHLVVFKALSLLQKQGIYPVVVCTGHLYDYRHPDYLDTVLQSIHRLGVANQVYIMGLIARTDQIQLIRRSLAVIQPSLFEGWSTIVEDARCLGKSLLLSDIPVHREQSPPNSFFFEPNSPENLASLLKDCWNQFLPGIDSDNERIAREKSCTEVQAFGYKFLEIAGV